MNQLPNQLSPFKESFLWLAAEEEVREIPSARRFDEPLLTLKWRGAHTKITEREASLAANKEMGNSVLQLQRTECFQ